MSLCTKNTRTNISNLVDFKEVSKIFPMISKYIKTCTYTYKSTYRRKKSKYGFSSRVSENDVENWRQHNDYEDDKDEWKKVNNSSSESESEDEKKKDIINKNGNGSSYGFLILNHDQTKILLVKSA